MSPLKTYAFLFVFAVFAVGMARAVGFGSGALVQRAVIHVSGSSTPPPAPPPSTPAPASPPTIYHAPSYRPYKAPETKPSGTSEPASPAPTNGIGFGPAYKAGQGGQTPETSVTPGATASRPAVVVSADGGIFTAERVTSGLTDDLRIDTGKGRVTLNLADADAIEFGKTDLNRLEIAVRLTSGTEIGGTIYSGTVFEFARAGGVTTVRAQELGSVKFIKEEK